MNRLVLGGVVTLLLVAVGLFWWQGRAEVERGAPPPLPEVVKPDPEDLPEVDPGELTGPEPPEATELTREQRRFFRYDRNRDLRSRGSRCCPHAPTGSASSTRTATTC
jgi:hypothetical protein